MKNMVIEYSELRNRLIQLNNKTPKVKEVIDKLYIWCLNDYFEKNQNSNATITN